MSKVFPWVPWNMSVSNEYGGTLFKSSHYLGFSHNKFVLLYLIDGMGYAAGSKWTLLVSHNPAFLRDINWKVPWRSFPRRATVYTGRSARKVNVQPSSVKRREERSTWSRKSFVCSSHFFSPARSRSKENVGGGTRLKETRIHLTSSSFWRMTWDGMRWGEVDETYLCDQVSWHNPGFKTPQMEELSRDGVRLSKSYVSPKCSPSRAALMTGIYPWRLGLQRGAIERYQATGLDPSKVLLPELLQKGGYATHLVRMAVKSNIFFYLRLGNGTSATATRLICRWIGASKAFLVNITMWPITTRGEQTFDVRESFLRVKAYGMAVQARVWGALRSTRQFRPKLWRERHVDNRSLYQKSRGKNPKPQFVRSTFPLSGVPGAPPDDPTTTWQIYVPILRGQECLPERSSSWSPVPLQSCGSDCNGHWHRKGCGRPQSCRHVRELCYSFHNGQRRFRRSNFKSSVIELSSERCKGVTVRGRRSWSWVGAQPLPLPKRPHQQEDDVHHRLVHHPPLSCRAGVSGSSKPWLLQPVEQHF